MLAKFAKAAIAATILAGPVAAEEQRIYFVGNGFFPDFTYAEWGDAFTLTNYHNAPATITMTGAVEIDGDGDDVADDGYTITLAENESVRFVVQNDGIRGYEVILDASSVNGGVAAEYLGLLSFDDDPYLGDGTAPRRIDNHRTNRPAIEAQRTYGPNGGS